MSSTVPTVINPLPAFAVPAKHHAILVATGFLIVLPIGVLVARYTRLFNRFWVWMHMIIQLFIAGPIILAGIGTGIKYTGSVQTGGNWVDPHKKMGLALLILYLVQVALGLFVHFFKTPRFMSGRRPPQNYIHAALGIIILACAFEQVHYGITIEWIEGTGGNPPVPAAAKRAWLAWVIVFWVLYLGGLVLVPHQYKRERAERERSKAGDDHLRLNQRENDKTSANGSHP